MLSKKRHRVLHSAMVITAGVALAVVMITGVAHAVRDGTMLNYSFPSEINLIPGEEPEADLIVTVKNTGDQRWTACEVPSWPVSEYYPSYRVIMKAMSWKPNSIYRYNKMYHIDPGDTDTSTNVFDGLPEAVGEYHFTLECEYHLTECTDSYQTMQATPVVISFRVVSIGNISGRITDANGDPAPGLGVSVYSDTARSELLGAGTTDSNGYYTIAGIRAGSAYVSIQRAGAIVWYDGQEGTEDPAEAARVTVTAGRTTSGINIGAVRRAIPWIPLLFD